MGYITGPGARPAQGLEAAGSGAGPVSGGPGKAQRFFPEPPSAFAACAPLQPESLRVVHGVRALVLVLVGKSPALMSRPQPVTTNTQKKRVNPKLRRRSLPDPATESNTARLSIIPKTELEKKGRVEKGGKKQVTRN